MWLISVVINSIQKKCSNIPDAPSNCQFSIWCKPQIFRSPLQIRKAKMFEKNVTLGTLNLHPGPLAVSARVPVWCFFFPVILWCFPPRMFPLEWKSTVYILYIKKKITLCFASNYRQTWWLLVHQAWQQLYHASIMLLFLLWKVKQIL